jgi:hypothetical protein
MGASVAGHSLRPLLIPRVEFLTNSGAMSRENADVCFSVISGRAVGDLERRIAELTQQLHAPPYGRFRILTEPGRAEVCRSLDCWIGCEKFLIFRI